MVLVGKHDLKKIAQPSPSAQPKKKPPPYIFLFIEFFFSSNKKTNMQQ
jgi:hypothetical protein